MSKMLKIKINVLFLVIMSIISGYCMAKPKCYGKLLNPITDVCWSCMFPMTVAGRRIADPNKDNATPTQSKKVFCKCGEPPLVRIGVPVGFWEIFRVADVTTKPYCMVSLNGMDMNLGMNPPEGGVQSKRGGKGSKSSLYHVHWYIYPLLAWMNIFSNTFCATNESFDIAYMTELDPLWDDDELSFWLNPEAVLFANPIAIAACAADCAAASFGCPLNPMFWCQGCQGSVYPLTGHITFHHGPVDASTIALQKMTFKLHREGLLHGSSGINGLCALYPMPWWKKNQYKYQLAYPKVAKNSKLACNPVGRTTALWGANKSYPIKGEDLSYVALRWRNCCVL